MHDSALSRAEEETCAFVVRRADVLEGVFGARLLAMRRTCASPAAQYSRDALAASAFGGDFSERSAFPYIFSGTPRIGCFCLGLNSHPLGR